MTFLHPEYLYLGFIIVPLGLLYLLKVRPRRRVTTTLFLWDSILAERKSSALLRRFRDLLSLLLLTLAVILATLGLAGPVFKDQARLNSLVLVIDNSNRSGALSENGNSLLELSKSAARGIMRNADDNCMISLATVSDSLKIKVNATGNRSRLFAELEKIKPDQNDFSAYALKSLRDTVKCMGGNGKAVLISGPTITPDKDIARYDVGKAAPNAAISGCDIQYLPGTVNKAVFWYRTASSFAHKKQVSLLICKETEGNIVRVRPATLVPGHNKPEYFILDNAEPGRWIFKLEIEDALAKDNFAYAVLRRQKPLRIGFSGTGNSFYQLCVTAFAESKLKTYGVSEEPDIVIASGSVDGKTSAQIIFKPYGLSSFWKNAGPLIEEAQPAKVLLPDHPGIRFCKLDDTLFKGVKKIDPPDNAVIVASTSDGVPLIYRTETTQGKAWVYNFDPEKSDFFLNLNFPLLVAGATADLSGRESLPPASFKTGSILSEKIAQTAGGETVVFPDGTEKSTTDVLPELSQAGFYQAGEKTFAASLLSSQAAIASEKLPQVKNFTISGGLPWGLIFICLSIALIAAESMLYHRRKAG